MGLVITTCDVVCWSAIPTRKTNKQSGAVQRGECGPDKQGDKVAGYSK